MSISSGGTRKAGPYSGNGITTAFPFTFKVFQASDLLVVQTDTTPTDNTLALTTDYTVSLNANQDANPGGTVTTNVAPPTGYLLTIGSQVPQLQSVTLTNNGGFYPTVINTALDYVTILIQQLSEKIGRALTMPFSTNASGQLPPVSPGSLLGWNQAGTGIANVGATGVGAGGIVASNMAAGATGTALSTDTQAAATKATPADADKIPLFDSAAFWGLKSLTWANLKATILTYLKTAFSGLVGTQVQISADVSPLWWGTQSTLSSGAAYVLNGNILIMEARCHNTQIDTSGNFTGVSETGIATVMFWGEDDVLRVFTGPSVTAGTVPTFGATPTYQLDMKTGSSSAASMPCMLNFATTIPSSTTMTMSADFCVVRDAAGLNRELIAGLNFATSNLAAAQGASAANGRDQSATFGAGWLYGYFIHGPGVADACLVSASATAPTLPAGYTKFHLACAQYWNGTMWPVGMVYRGRDCHLDNAAVAGSGLNATVETALSVATLVPPKAQEMELEVYGTRTSDSSNRVSGQCNLRYMTGVNACAFFANTTGFSANAGGCPTYPGLRAKIPNIGQSFFYVFSGGYGTADNNTIMVRGFTFPNGAF